MKLPRHLDNPPDGFPYDQVYITGPPTDKSPAFVQWTILVPVIGGRAYITPRRQYIPEKSP